MINEQQIRKWWNIFIGDGNFTEIRILGKFQYSGYFNSIDALIRAITPYSDMDAEQIYFVLNKIDDACYGRQQSGRIIKSPKITTNDNDIIRRTWCFIDFDPIRKSGVNASDEEYNYALVKAREVFKFLRDRGFSEPVICKSGNGIHLQYKVDLPPDAGTTEIIKHFYEYLGKQFTDDKVDIDTKVFNLARLCKAYGTVAKKGANLQERPWRMSEIIHVPGEIKTTPLEKFKELADMLPKDEPKPTTNHHTFSNAPFDLVAWLNEHGIKFREKKSGTSTQYELEECPWIDTHSDRKKWDSTLYQDADGKITFNCHHSHCDGKTWRDFRLFYEPNAYDKPLYQPQRYSRYQYQKPKYEIKGEVPELGKKWLMMSQIKKVDLSSIEGVKTGFTELDRYINKLHFGEVTLLSGSNASGKSSWLNTLILNIANQHVPIALYSGELPETILKTWIQMAAAGKHNLCVSQYGDGKYYVPNNVGEKIDRWLDNLLYIYNTDYGSQWEQIFSDMGQMVDVGVKVFILDNLMSMNIDLLDGDSKNDKQRNVILSIKKFAKDKNVHIVLVAHPRKSMAFLRKNDISGSSDLSNAVDDIFIIHRVNNDFFRAGSEFFGQAEIQRYQGFGNVLEIAKNRMFGIVDLMVGMQYEIESRRFKNTDVEDIHYAWEDEPTQVNIEYPNPTYNSFAQSAPKQNAQFQDMPFPPPSGDAPF